MEIPCKLVKFMGEALQNTRGVDGERPGRSLAVVGPLMVLLSTTRAFSRRILLRSMVVK